MAPDQNTVRLSELIQASSRIVALTGAGISTSAGLPDFRSPQSGLWNVLDMEAFTSTGFLRSPHKLYQLIQRLVPAQGTIQPTLGHRWLAWLEAQDTLTGLLTQNVDGLHQKAGSKQVVELHGNCISAHCVGCGESGMMEDLLASMEGVPNEVPQCELCGGIYKPDVILFGDLLPPEAFRTGTRWARECDLFLVLGSSLQVAPASDLPWMALRQGAKLAILNLEETPLDDQAELVLHEDIDEVVSRLWDRGS